MSSVGTALVTEGRNALNLKRRPVSGKDEIDSAANPGARRRRKSPQGNPKWSHTN